MTIVRRTVLALPFAAAFALRARAQGAPMKVGVIGAGHIGGTLGALWVKAGHPVMFASRNPDQLKEMAGKLGPLASVGTPAEAAAFGEAVMVAVPFKALPQLGKDLAAALRGKVVLDPTNATAGRDGAEMAKDVETRGIGVVAAGYFPGAHLVRVFNSLGWQKLVNGNHRADPVAVPLAGDDPAALRVAEQLVRDAGFAPLVTGGLATASKFQMGQPGYGAVQEELTVPVLKQRLGV